MSRIAEVAPFPAGTKLALFGLGCFLGAERKCVGLMQDPAAVEETALFGSIRMLNRYHFPEANIPVTGDLKLTATDRAPEAVVKAKRNLADVLAKCGTSIGIYKTKALHFTMLNQTCALLDCPGEIDGRTIIRAKE